MRCIECIASDEQADRTTDSTADTSAYTLVVTDYELRRNVKLAKTEKFALELGINITPFSLAPSTIAAGATAAPACDNRDSAGGARRLAFIPADDSSRLRPIELEGPLQPGRD